MTSVKCLNPFECKGNYSATANNVKLVHWPLMGGLLHLVQRGGDWAGPRLRATLPISVSVDNDCKTEATVDLVIGDD